MDAREDERGREVRPRLLTQAAPLLALLALCSAPAVAAAQEPTGRLLVTLAPGVAPTAQTAAAVAQDADARPTAGRIPQLDIVAVRPDPGRTLRETVDALRADPAVAAVEVDRRAYAYRAPTNDPALSEAETQPGTPAGTPRQWWAGRQNLFAAWDVTRGGGALVAVIDSGIDATHPELQGKIRQAQSVGFTSSPATVDENGHGTHVASIACAAGDNGVALVGAGLDCGLIVLKTDLSAGSVARAIVEATDRGAHAVNMSFGTDGSAPASPAVVDALDYAFRRDVVLVAAAADAPVEEQGDPSNVVQPTGTGPDITQGRGLSVTSADFSDRRSSFAGRGTQISLAAYGSFSDRDGPPGILGAFPAAETEIERGEAPLRGCSTCRTQIGGDNRYAFLQGTSMAAPMVAATGALVRALNPDLGAGEVVRLLKQTARRAPGAGWSPELGWGILDAGAALSVARTLDRRPPRSSVQAVRTVRRARAFTVRLRSADLAPAGVAASGVRVVELWRSANGRAYQRIARTRKPTVRLRARPGSRYRFYTVAVDRAGNREPMPSRAGAVTRVSRTAGR